MNKEDKVLIVDSMNLFIRNFIVNPKLGSGGEPMGGVFGFLSSLQKLSREIKPNMIVLCYDGVGGSKRRRRMFSGYKDGRKPVRLNRSINQGLSSDEEEVNKNIQFIKLIEYLNDMPVIQLILDDVEADDIIARVCNLKSLQGKMKLIISSDKDFIQLCNQEVFLVRPVQKEVLNVPRILDKFSIHPNNFAVARAIVGDKSDNLDGISGAGLKTVAKRFPFLKEEKSYLLGEIFDYCIENKGKFKLFEDILDNKDKTLLNYKMMQLYVPNISAQASTKIKYVFDNFKPSFRKMDIIKKMAKDGFLDYNWDSLFQTFKLISSSEI